MVELHGSPDEKPSAALTAETDLGALLTAILGDSAAPERVTSDFGIASIVAPTAMLATSQLLVGPLRDQIAGVLAASDVRDTALRPEQLDLGALDQPSNGARTGTQIATSLGVSAAPAQTGGDETRSQSKLPPVRRVHGGVAQSGKRAKAWVVTAPPQNAGARGSDAPNSVSGALNVSHANNRQTTRDDRVRAFGDAEPDFGALDGRLVSTQPSVADLADLEQRDVFAGTSGTGQRAGGRADGRRWLMLIVMGIAVVSVLAWLAVRQPA